MADHAELRIGDQTISLPIVVGTEGEKAIDIQKLRAQTGYITLDPGYANTGSCRSAITFIDGDEGILRYRGYPIEQLAEKATFLEVAYLLIYGELPTADELTTFEGKVSDRMMLDERMRELYRCFPRGAHPMQVLAAGVMALGSFNRDTLAVDDPDQVESASLRLLGSMPTLAAYAY